MAASDWEIREIQPPEYAGAGALVAAAYVNDHLVDPDDEYVSQLSNVADRAASPGTAVLVAVGKPDSEHPGVLGGTITVAEVGSSYADIAQAGELELRMLGVAPQLRGARLGERLMRAAIDRAHARGLSAVFSMVPGNVNAQRLYERMQLGRVPERDWTIPELPELGTMQVFAAPPTVNPSA